MTRNGFSNDLEYYLLTHFELIWRLTQRIDPVERLVNKFLINRAVSKAPSRPNPFSLLQDFTSWDSLTRREFTGRHLPPASTEYTDSLPSVEQVANAFRRHADCYRLSSTSTQLFNHFAQWFTDGFLRTDRSDYRKNTSNHEIDLSPVYGRTLSISNTLRVFKNGLLKAQIINGCEFPPFYLDSEGRPKDEFKDNPVFFEAPIPQEQQATLFAMGVERANVQFGYVMLNTLFLREHNRLATQIGQVNPNWDDERIFQTARNCVIVLVIKIVIEEYINHIAPYFFKFKAQPRSFYGAKWYRNNWMTVEFNLLYRWHGLVTSKIKVGGIDLTTEETVFNNNILLNRGLGACFDDSSRYPCGDIGLFNTVDSLIRTEEASLRLGRMANLQPYNAYRQYCNYPPATKFSDITNDLNAQNKLKELYGTPDRVELYTGLFAEDRRVGSPLSPLIGRMVGIDAFSQALTNPLLSKRVFNETTFSESGWKTINETQTLSDIVHRNLQDETCDPLVTFEYSETHKA